MCGVCGLVRVGGGVDTEIVERMGDALIHRGPDQGGTYFSPAAPLGVGLATRRLAILDLSAAGSQPMATPDGAVCIAYNGEIYNEPELRRELAAQGYAYRSESDTETVLYAYHAYGLKMFPQLNGMFAVAIFDRPRQRVILARDRMGIKPLYYHWDGRRLAFASELRPLLRCAGIAAEPDADGLDLYLTCGYMPSPFSLIRGVRKLPPGSYLVLGADGAITIEQFWMPPYPERRPRAELAAEVRDTIHDAVRRQMRSDVPVGVLLSGGVDSTIVATSAALQTEHPLSTFSIAFKSAGSPIDAMYNADSHFARRVAAAIGATHHEIVCDDSSDVPGLLSELAGGLDEPVWEPSFVSIYLMSRLAREHGVKVLLTGDGSDELFAGYPWIAGAWRQEQYGRIPFVRALLPLATRVIPADSAIAGHARNLRAFMDTDELARYEWLYAVFDQTERLALTGHHWSRTRESPLAKLLGPLQAGGAGCSRADTMARLDLALWVREHFNQRLDRMTMLNSIEARVPFQDDTVVDLALRLPFSAKAWAGHPKKLLRDAFRHEIPEFVLRRPKRPFAAPAWAWGVGALRSFATSTLTEERVRWAGLVDPVAAQRALAATESQRQDRGTTKLWTLLMLQLWAEGLGVRGNPATAARIANRAS
jgi:asparagine synthase (glutamine-hydrolysing)